MSEQIIIFLQIVFIDLVLAGDNAIIIGMVASKFPLDQRKKIIFWGIGGGDGIPKTYEKINGIWQIKQDRGTGYRLPTEAEWSWAARESNQINRIFPWGDKMPPPDKFGN